LRFGRFLTDVRNAENLPKNLTEGRFRSYWERITGANERQRFAVVQDLMAADLSVISERRPKIGPAIVEQFAYGKWHHLDTIAKAVDATEDHVEATFHHMLAHETYGTLPKRK
jgi:hypothetical protein